MERDARRMRGERPFVFTNLRTGEGVDEIVALDPAPSCCSTSRRETAAARARRARRSAAAPLRAARRATVLTGCRFTLPLQVLAPVALDDPAAVVSILNPTGGVLGGDRLVDRRRRSASGAHAVPDHAVGDAHLPHGGEPAVQTVRLRSGVRGAIVEWVPDHTIPSAGSALRQSFDVEIGDGARLILVDAFAAGRVARGEAWRFARLDSALTVRDARGLLLHDRFVLRGGGDWDRAGAGRGAAVLRDDRPRRRYRARALHRRSARRAARGRSLPRWAWPACRAAERWSAASPRTRQRCRTALAPRVDVGPRAPARSAPTTPSQALANTF